VLNTDQRLLSISEIFAAGLLFGLAGGLGAGVQSGLATGWADGIIPWLQCGLWGMLYGLGIGVLSGIVVSMAICGLTLLTYPAQKHLSSSHLLIKRSKLEHRLNQLSNRTLVRRTSFSR